MSPERELVERMQRATLAWQAIVTIRRADKGPRERSRWLGNGRCGYWVIAATASVVVVGTTKSKLPGPPPKLKVGPTYSHVIPWNNDEKIGGYMK